MVKIIFIDRKTKKKCEEKVYWGWALGVLYGNHLFSKIFSMVFLPWIAQVPAFSKFYGWLQNKRFSSRKILPFIKTYHLNPDEWVKKPEEFSSFNDFFIRKLKKKTRPLSEKKAMLFADARYLFYPNISSIKNFIVKGQKFCLKEFLKDEKRAQKYEKGSMVIARLCPTDYHRYHFPFDCEVSKSQKINGALFSVNPTALKKKIGILWENKRVLTHLKSQDFGDVIYVEVGATYVGSIHQTFKSNASYKKGDEKGYFSFGGSCIILLFEPQKIRFDEDLLEASNQNIEIRGLLGQSMGVPF